MEKFHLAFVVVFLFLLSDSRGQSDSVSAPILTETVATDSISKLETATIKKKKKGNFVKRFFKDDYPSPRKAVILTAVLPGLGQMYNKKHWYWKLPVIYGAFGGLIYGITFNTKEYKFLKEEHNFMVDGDPSTVSRFEGLVSSTVLKTARDQYDKWRQLSYIGIGLAYILTAAEAYTTAHLLSFDVSDDLSMQFKPNFDFVPEQGMVMGFGVRFNLQKTKSPQPSVIFQK